MATAAYDVRTFGTDARCTKPSVITVFKSGPCVPTRTCESGNVTECAVTNYRSAVHATFGSTPYVLIERFDDDSNCTKFSSAAAVPSDGGCYGLVSGATFFQAQLTANKTLIVQQYNNAECKSAAPQDVLVATAEQRDQFACIESRLLTLVGEITDRSQTLNATALPSSPSPSTSSEGSISVAPPPATSSVVSDLPPTSRGADSVQTNEQATTGSSSSVWIGVVLGVAAALLIAAFMLVRRRRRTIESHSNASVSPAIKHIDTDIITDYQGGPDPQLPPMFRPPPSGDTFFARDRDLKAYRQPVEEIRDERVIGAGAFCVVWRVRIRNSIAVASKRLKDEKPSQDQIVHFIEEIKLSAKLAHPRVVEFIGVAWTNNTDLQALFEYMENGTLRSWLRKNIYDGERGTWSEDKLQMAIDVAEALAYMHSFVPPLVHRDLKSSNVLLNIDLRAKLSDFGIARFKSYESTMTAGAGTTLWLSPEVIAGRQDYDQRTDVFAFGVLLSELDTHELPYFDARDEAGDRMIDVVVAQKIVDGKLKPAFSPSCPPPVRELALSCLSFDPRDRPAADDVLFRLHQVKRSPEYIPII